MELKGVNITPHRGKKLKLSLLNTRKRKKNIRT